MQTSHQQKNQNARLEFAKNDNDKQGGFWKKVLWTDETKINQNNEKPKVWRKEETAHDPKHSLICEIRR